MRSRAPIGRLWTSLVCGGHIVTGVVNRVADEAVATGQHPEASNLSVAAESYRLLTDSVQDYAIFMLDPGGRVVTWNRGAERIKGYGADEILGCHFSRFYTAEDVRSGLCERELQTALREGRVEDEGYRVRKGGTLFWAHVVITALRDSSGGLVGFAKVTRDLTERRASERERLLLAEATAARVSAEQALARLECLQALTAATVAATTLADLAHVVVNEGPRLVGARVGMFWRARGEGLALVAVRGGDGSPMLDELELQASALPARALRERAAIWASSFQELAEAAPGLSGDKGGLSFGAIPLAIRERAFGAVVFGFNAAEEITVERRTLLETFAAQIAQAIERIDVFEREVSARERLEALARASEALACAATTRDVAHVALEHAMALSGADYCALYDYDRTRRTLNLRLRRGEGPELIELLLRAAAQRRSDSEPEAMLHSAIWLERVVPPDEPSRDESNVSGALCHLPISDERTLIGSLCLGFRAPRRFAAFERDFIETYARHATDAWLRASRQEEERAARVRAEALQASLATTLHSIGDAVIATDRDGNITFVNAMAEALIGSSDESARGRPLADVFRMLDEHTGAPSRSPVEAVLATGARFGSNSDAWLDTARARVPIEYSAAPISGRDQRLDGVVLVFRDVSERKCNELRRALLADAAAVLAESLDYSGALQRVAEMTLPRLADICAIAVVDEESSEPKPLAVAHIDAEKLDVVRRLVEPSAGSGAMLGIASVIESGRAQLHPVVSDEVLRAITGDEQRLQAGKSLGMSSAVIAPLLARGRALGALVFAYAGSRRVYIERDRDFADELARRCAVAIDNAQLYAAEQRARTSADIANRAKDEFLAMVSHELRTPLNAIMGWARLMASGGLDVNKQARAVETIERNTVAMAQLIEDLLDVSRIISGKMRLTVRPVDLAAVIEGAIESARPAADARQVRIVQRVDPALGFVTGDQNRISQVIWNLLNNAIKFTGPGGKIEVEATRVEASICVRVQDTGKGIAPEFLPLMFVPFRQQRGSTSKARGGLGLGLAITRQLVELHGGTIEAESDGEGRGATFTIHLPTAAAKRSSRPPSQHARQIPPSRAVERPSQLDGLSVLAVDDDQDARELIQMLLENCGCKVTVASGVDEAMEAIAERNFDLLISDIGMPGQDGYDLIRRVRALPASRGGSIPAAALTAYARTEDRNRALKAGFSMHLPKPVEPAELLGAVVSLARFAATSGP